MPNLNKMRGGMGGHPAPPPNNQYGLSQARYTSSDSRLLPPTSRIQGQCKQEQEQENSRNMEVIDLYIFQAPVKWVLQDCDPPNPALVLSGPRIALA